MLTSTNNTMSKLLRTWTDGASGGRYDWTKDWVGDYFPFDTFNQTSPLVFTQAVWPYERVSEDGTTIEVALPGVPKEKINVFIENDNLTVKYSLPKEESEKISFANIPAEYERTWTIGSVDEQDVKVSFVDGILKIQTKKKRPKKIPISIGK